MNQSTYLKHLWFFFGELQLLFHLAEERSLGTHHISSWMTPEGTSMWRQSERNFETAPSFKYVRLWYVAISVKQKLSCNLLTLSPFKAQW
jgi:hypothetical protein